MVEDLDEASNELIITDEDSVRFSVGETFVLVENDDAESMLEAHLEETRGEVEALEAEKKELTGAMAELGEALQEVRQLHQPRGVSPSNRRATRAFRVTRL